MRKKLILITILLGSVPLFLMGYNAYRYYAYQGSNFDRTMMLHEKIEKIDADVMKKKEMIEKIKHSNDEKIGILRLWKKRLEKIKN